MQTSYGSARILLPVRPWFIFLTFLLALLLNLLPAWLRSEGVDLKTIGFFALIQFPYTWKFL